MKKEITLGEYLKMGGKLEKVNWDDAYCEYYDENRNVKIISYQDKGEKNGLTPLIYFTFDNGNTKRYSINLIKIKVDFVLSETYL